MKPLTQKGLYEYRMKIIVRRVLNELGLFTQNMNADELAQKLWEHNELLGRAVVQDMYEWMSEDDWYKLVNNG